MLKNHLLALLRKNWILWKRNLTLSLCEIAIPITFVVFMIILRMQTNKLEMDEKSYLEEVKIINPQPEQIIGDWNFMKKCIQKDGDQSSKKIVLSPQNDLTLRIQQRLLKIQGVSEHLFDFFDSNNQIDTYVTSDDYGSNQAPKICFAIVFTKSKDSIYEYSLRFSSDNAVLTLNNDPINQDASQKIQRFEDYINLGYASLINLISNTILEIESAGSKIEIYPSVLPIKQKAFVKDEFYQIANTSFHYYLIVPLISTFLKMTYALVIEKESKIREGMKMMGMRNISFYLSWILTYSTIYFIISIIISALLVFLIFQQANFFLIFIWHYSFCLTLIFQSLFITVFFTKALQGIFFAFFVFILQFYYQYTISSQDRIQIPSKNDLVTMIFSNHYAMFKSALEFSYLTSQGKSIDFSLLNQNEQNTTIQQVFIAFFVNIGIFGILFLYLDQVFPNEFGSKKHPLFFIPNVISYFKNSRSKKYEITKDNRTETDLITEEVEFSLEDQVIRKEALVIQNLVKVFKNKKNIVNSVNDLNITMYKNQVFCLLGNNGAGKTTIISIINGLIQQTSGNVTIKGLDTTLEMSKIRKIIGVCPQEDILFDELTILEHLELYCILKGVPQKFRKTEIENILNDLNLNECANFQSKNLSGGTKRKLSIAIAFIGQSEVIILDEPTNGMDAEARRNVWSMIKNYKQGKIIILTTHYMDEADYLSDRIGIIKDGVLKCVGSSLFLKQKYGKGFNITFEMADKHSPSYPLIQYVQNNLQDVIVMNDACYEVAFQVPKDNIQYFKEFFKNVEQNKKKLYIKSYSVSIATLEQVFLNVVDNTTDSVILRQKSNTLYENQKLYQSADNFNLNKTRNIDYYNVFKSHLYALLRKRIIYFKRDYNAIFCELIFPILITLFCFTAFSIQSISDQPDRELTLNLYSKNQIMIGGGGDSDSDFSKYITRFPKYPSLTINKSLQLTNLNDFDEFLFNQNNEQLKFATFFKGNLGIGNQVNYTSFINIKNGDAVVISINAINNAIINEQTKKSILIKPHNYPLKDDIQLQMQKNQKRDLSIIIIFAIAFSFFPASSIAFIVKERVELIKHQQIISGASLFVYWVSNFIVDLLKYLVIGIICPLLVLPFQHNPLSQAKIFLQFYALVLLYGPSMILFTYVLNFFVTRITQGQIISFFIHFMFGSVLPAIIFYLKDTLPSAINLIDNISYIFTLIPIFDLTQGMLSIISQDSQPSLFITKEQQDKLNKIQGYGIYFLMMGFTLFFYLLLLRYLELNTGKSQSKKEKSVQMEYKKYSNDILEEIRAVVSSHPKDYTLHVKELRKVFFPKRNQPVVALNNIYLGVEQGQIFTLLGANGAGKTTMMRMLTCDEKISIGQVHIAGLKIPEDLPKVKQFLGFCPQQDALLDKLTAKEHLQLYSALKGVPKFAKNDLIQQKLVEMHLKHLENQCPISYSVGNKRKLSVANALIGNPSLIFLDEPSTGLDPINKRFMWDVAHRISTQFQTSSIILATHSMEEAEALSSRIGIMVAGNFECLGTLEQLKQRFSKGYEIEIKTQLPTLEQIEQQYEGLNLNEQVLKNELYRFLQMVELEDMFYAIKPNGQASQLYYEFEKKSNQNEGVELKLVLEFGLINQRANKVEDFMKQKFSNVHLIEQINNFQRFHIDTQKTIGEVFGILNEAESNLNINFYNVKRITLEQIFNKIVTSSRNGKKIANIEETELIQQNSEKQGRRVTFQIDKK